MKRMSVLLAILLVLTVTGCGRSAPTATLPTALSVEPSLAPTESPTPFPIETATPQSSPTPSESFTLAPTPTETPAPTATPIPAETPTSTPPKKELGPLGLIIWEMGEGKFVVWEILHPFIPPGGGFPKYNFPLSVGKTEAWRGILSKILTSIPDPNLNEVGQVWESALIRDEDYERFVLKVKLTRVNNERKYQGEFSFSPDNGNRWLTIDFPTLTP